MSATIPLTELFPKTVHTIALVAPASPASDSQLLDTLLEDIRLSHVQFKLMPNARVGEPGDTYGSIDAKLRADDLQQAWLDPEVQLILPIRGGGGGLELIKELDWERLRQRPTMPVFGFSDLTILHAAMLAKQCGRPIASPTFMDLSWVSEDSQRSFQTVLAGHESQSYHLLALRTGSTKGLIFAAHLQRLASLIDTPFMPSLKNRILFLECPHRNEDQIQAIFDNMVDSYCLNHVQAVVFGQFPDCSSPEAAENLQRHMASRLRCPTLSGFPFGHTQLLHTLDSYATASVTSDGTLTLHHSSMDF